MARAVGRPDKLTPEVHAILVEALASGCYRQNAAQLAGIGTSTLYRWLEQGEADAEQHRDTPRRELWEAINRAEAAAEAHALAMIRQAMHVDWRAAAHFLERRYPAQWGKRDALKVEHSGGITHDVRQMTDADLTELAGELGARRAGTS